MRKITEQAVTAFLKGKTFREGNTQVLRAAYEARLYLHGNLIARRNFQTGEIRGTLANWPTQTTRDRLNGIARAVNGCGVYQQNHCQRLDTGKRINADDWFTICKNS